MKKGSCDENMTIFSRNLILLTSDYLFDTMDETNITYRRKVIELF